MFYGWIIAASALFALFVTNGLTIGGLTVFDEQLLREFGWSRGALKLRDFIQFALAGALAPLAGALADRFGIRPLLLVGASLTGVCIALYSRIQSAGHMYALHALFAAALAAAGLVVNVMLVSRWFVARRGTAIGIALVGTSLGGMVLPPVGTALIAALGWRGAFLALSALPALLVLVVLFVVRDDPARMGLAPLGAAGGGAGAGPVSASGVPYAEAVRTRTFWAIATIAMMTFYSILGVSAHLFLHLRGLGFAPPQAARGIALLFGMGLVGKFLWGYLADVLDRRLVFLTNLGVMLLGSLCLASLSPGLFWPFVVLFGVGWGGLYTMLQLLTMDSFGLRDSGKILGTITILDAVGGGLGPWITGLLFDRAGSYAPAFWLVAGLVAVSLLIGSTLTTSRASPA
jgi:MFS family permease